MAKIKRLNFKDWWDHVGTVNVLAVLAHAKVKLPYARQMRYGAKVPGEFTARRLILAAITITPGWVPDYSLMRSGVEASGKHGGAIPPSAEFLRSLKK